MSKIRPSWYVLEVCGNRFAPIRWWGERKLSHDPEELIDDAIEFEKLVRARGQDPAGCNSVRVRRGLWVVWENYPKWVPSEMGTWKKCREASKCHRPAMPGTRLDPTIPTEDHPPRVRNHGIPRDGRRGIKKRFHHRQETDQ